MQSSGDVHRGEEQRSVVTYSPVVQARESNRMAFEDSRRKVYLQSQFIHSFMDASYQQINSSTDNYFDSSHTAYFTPKASSVGGNSFLRSQSNARSGLFPNKPNNNLSKQNLPKKNSP